MSRTTNEALQPKFYRPIFSSCLVVLDLTALSNSLSYVTSYLTVTSTMRLCRQNRKMLLVSHVSKKSCSASSKKHVMLLSLAEFLKLIAGILWNVMENIVEHDPLRSNDQCIKSCYSCSFMTCIQEGCVLIAKLEAAL